MTQPHHQSEYDVIDRSGIVTVGADLHGVAACSTELVAGCESFSSSGTQLFDVPGDRPGYRTHQGGTCSGLHQPGPAGELGLDARERLVERLGDVGAADL